MPTALVIAALALGLLGFVSGALALRTLGRVRRSVGLGGANADYVRATYAHLVELGLDDPDLAWIVAGLQPADPPLP